MPTTARPPLSPDDAFGIHVSTLARATARWLLILHTTDTAGFVRTLVIRRALIVARAVARRDDRAMVCVQDEADVYGCTSPETQVEYAELVALIELTVASLPPVCRRVYQMVREDDAPYAAIALTLGIRRDTVKEHLTAAQRRLRAALVDAGVIAAPLPHVGPSRVTSKGNEVPAQRPDPAANRQDSAA